MEGELNLPRVPMNRSESQKTRDLECRSESGLPMAASDVSELKDRSVLRYPIELYSRRHGVRSGRESESQNTRELWLWSESL